MHVCQRCSGKRRQCRPGRRGRSQSAVTAPPPAPFPPPRQSRAHRRRRWPGQRGAPRARREGRERRARAGARQRGGGASAQGDANQSINFKLCLKAPPPSGRRPPQSAWDRGSGRSEHRAEEQPPAPASGPARAPGPPAPPPALHYSPGAAAAESADMSFPQLGYPQYLSAAGPGAYGGERPGVLAAAAAAAASSGRPGAAELGAGAAAVTSVLGMYAAAGPYAGAPGYSAFLPYAADLSLFSQMVSAPGPARSSPGRRVPAGPGAPGRGARAGGRARGKERGGRAGAERAGLPGRGARAALLAVPGRRGAWAARRGWRATAPPSRPGRRCRRESGGRRRRPGACGPLLQHPAPARRPARTASAAFGRAGEAVCPPGAELTQSFPSLKPGRGGQNPRNNGDWTGRRRL